MDAGIFSKNKDFRLSVTFSPRPHSEAVHIGDAEKRKVSGLNFNLLP
jgi:hypothetical protein